MGVEPTGELLCRQPPYRLAPASRASSPGIEPGPQPSQGCMPIQHTPRTYLSLAARRGVEPRLAVSRTAVRSGTLAGCMNQYPDLDLNQGLDLRRVQCVPLHHRDTSTSARSRTPWSSFGGCRLSQEHTRVLLLGSRREQSSQGIRRESNPYLLVHSQACSDRYTTDTMSINSSTRI